MVEEAHLLHAAAQPLTDLRRAIRADARHHDHEMLIVVAGHHIIRPAQAVLQYSGDSVLQVFHAFEAEIALVFRQVVD